MVGKYINLNQCAEGGLLHEEIQLRQVGLSEISSMYVSKVKQRYFINGSEKPPITGENSRKKRTMAKI